MSIFKELYQYREMIVSMVKRELKGRYKGSVLGILWSFLNPLLQLVVYTIVFSYIMRSNIEDYYIFLFVALIPWMFLSTSVTIGSSCVRAQKEMVNKIYFPREILPISVATSQFVNMLYAFIVVFAVLVVSGKGVSFKALIYLPFIMIIEYFFVLGLTFIVAAITVYFRDLEYITGILVMAWQFLTPVMYSIDTVPEGIFRKIFELNPMTPIIVNYREILYDKMQPTTRFMGIGCIYSVLFLIVGFWVFRQMQKRFSEVL